MPCSLCFASKINLLGVLTVGPDKCLLALDVRDFGDWTDFEIGFVLIAGLDTDRLTFEPSVSGGRFICVLETVRVDFGDANFVLIGKL